MLEEERAVKRGVGRKRKVPPKEINVVMIVIVMGTSILGQELVSVSHKLL